MFGGFAVPLITIYQRKIGQDDEEQVSTLFSIACLLASLPAAADWNQAYFRGTANNWQTESLSLIHI